MTEPVNSAPENTGANTSTNTSELSPAQIAALTADAKGWTPEDGDELEGTVLAIKSGYSDVQDRNYPIVFILTDTGECVAVHAFQTVIENEMRQQRPMPGERIYVKRVGATGEAKKKGYSPVIKYAVHVARQDGSNDPWEHMGGAR